MKGLKVVGGGGGVIEGLCDGGGVPCDDIDILWVGDINGDCVGDIVSGDLFLA